MYPASGSPNSSQGARSGDGDDGGGMLCTWSVALEASMLPLLTCIGYPGSARRADHLPDDDGADDGSYGGATFRANVTGAEGKKGPGGKARSVASSTNSTGQSYNKFHEVGGSLGCFSWNERFESQAV